MKSFADCLISPSGNIIPLVLGSHIGTVIANPVKFGYTVEYIESVYESYGESIGVEGKAREEILVDMFKKGWLRVNYDIRSDAFNINTWGAQDNTLEKLQDFAVQVASGYFNNKKLRFSTVNIHDVSDNTIYRTDIDRLLKGKIALKELSMIKVAKIEF